MDKIRNSHLFVVFLGIAIALNIFVNLTTSLLQKHVGLAISPGPLVGALLWSFGIAVIIAAVTAYMSGVFTPATATTWTDKKTSGLEKTFYAFFITATFFMIINLFGEKKFYQTWNAVAILAGIVAVGNLMLPSITLWFQRLGDAHNENIKEKLSAKKEPKKKGSGKKPVDSEPGTSWIKWGIGIIIVIVLLRQCGNNSHSPINYDTTSTSDPATNQKQKLTDWGTNNRNASSTGNAEQDLINDPNVR